MPEKAVLHLIMNCIPALDTDLLDSFLASPRKYALHLLPCPMQTPSHPRSVFHCGGQTLPPSASRCVLAPQHAQNSWQDPYPSPGTTWFLHNVLSFSCWRKHAAASSNFPERWSWANILPGPGSILKRKSHFDLNFHVANDSLLVINQVSRHRRILCCSPIVLRLYPGLLSPAPNKQ